jgi:hypothetical protein
MIPVVFAFLGGVLVGVFFGLFTVCLLLAGGDRDDD